MPESAVHGFEDEEYVAIDVECVATGVGYLHRAVGSIAAVDQSERCIFFEYVRPDVPVRSCLTPLTSIRPENIHNAGRLPDVVSRLRRLLSPRKTVLVGHGVALDIDWLGLKPGRDFKRSEDSGDLFAFYPEGPLGWRKTFSLRHICIHALGVDPQASAHSPEVDARFSMRLLNQYGRGRCRREQLDTLTAHLREKPTTPSFDVYMPYIDGCEVSKRSSELSLTGSSPWLNPGAQMQNPGSLYWPYWSWTDNAWSEQASLQYAALCKQAMHQVAHMRAVQGRRPTQLSGNPMPRFAQHGEGDKSVLRALGIDSTRPPVGTASLGPPLATAPAHHTLLQPHQSQQASGMETVTPIALQATLQAKEKKKRSRKARSSSRSDDSSTCDATPPVTGCREQTESPWRGDDAIPEKGEAAKCQEDRAQSACSTEALSESSLCSSLSAQEKEVVDGTALASDPACLETLAVPAGASSSRQPERSISSSGLAATANSSCSEFVMSLAYFLCSCMSPRAREVIRSMPSPVGKARCS
eukprot:TRINITY_DN59067_c0_g1_i1.p1 TRINITY_DN59067_c0_g1~~TRINITY_DN59067_c0_g1_i1.p1  ORF type:complete len:527 (+),score=46.68 TRINITY_DN59067_c0_g1_i1:107-1687(+)